ncbi:MAG: LPS translocon maturation chaperone LptM [Betaproteobacteria bacterium]
MKTTLNLPPILGRRQVLVLVLAALGLAGCGQTGPLYLPPPEKPAPPTKPAPSTVQQSPATK